MKIVSKLFHSKKIYSIILALDILALVVVFVFLIYGSRDTMEEKEPNYEKQETIVDSQEVEFEDQELEKAIKKALGKKKIYEEDIKKIKKITIKNNKKIKDFSELEKFVNVKEITITGCNFYDISIFRQMSQLEIVNLKGNSIEFLEGNVELATIRELNLSNNKLTNLNFLKLFPELIKLDISSNKITDISAIGVCRKLQYVNLLNNMVKNEEHISSLEDLHTIYVDEEFERISLEFMVGNFKNADVWTKKYLLEKQYNLN